MSSQLFPTDLGAQTPLHGRRMMIKFDLVIKEVYDTIAPVWPLKDYVAVNPYFGLADRHFMSARAFLKVFSDCETLMPLEHYVNQWRIGNLEQRDIEEALQEIHWPASIEKVSARDLVERLDSSVDKISIASSDVPSHVPPIRTVVDHAAKVSGVHWREVITNEISKHCAAHYDDEQASWGNGWKDQSLYQAWHETAQIDRNAELLGLTGMRRLVSSLPRDARTAAVDLLCRMKVPYPLWSTVLLSQLFSIPGWCAWAKYQDEQMSADDHPQTLTGLLAIRLAYDYALSQALGLEVDWSSYAPNGSASFQCEESTALQLSWVRYSLMRAMEVRYRRHVLSSMQRSQCDSATPATAKPKQVQMVFCIDVRSERMRRQLESCSPTVETLGFAGFFGVPMQYVPLAEPEATAQLPVLLQPQFSVHECLDCASPDEQLQVAQRRIEIRSWRKLWQSFKSSSIGSFGFVESSGLWAGFQLVRQMFGRADTLQHMRDGLRTKHENLRPSLHCHDSSGHGSGDLSSPSHIELAARALTNMGLTKEFAKLVVFCGHFSQTNNNPLSAGLDCGACGGHSGATNARWLALLLNQTDVRIALCERGILIPPDTHFVAAGHNTTTDEIEFYDVQTLPQSHRHDLACLQDVCQDATRATARERLPQLNGQRIKEVFRRAADWSEVRPEWGLVGNAAFIIGPRSMTSTANLNGRTFLHSYDAQQDPNGTVLEGIMTAPMIVANWINMQYFASTVDNTHFGSGSKTIHNVVGKFGILAGNSGDLRTGLPLQSLHDGTHYRHLPMRLLVVICAPRDQIQRIVQQHELVANLVNNEWLSIVAIEDGIRYRLVPHGAWEELDGCR